MKIQICGSMNFAKEMMETQKLLEQAGHEAWVPGDADYHVAAPGLNNDLQTDLQHCLETDVMRKCYDAIALADAVVVLNYPKNGVDGYIGISTLMEMSLAYYFRKPIYLLHPIPSPEQARWVHEVQVFQPTILNGDWSVLLVKN